MNRGTWIGNGDAAEKVSLTAWDDVLGFPGFELETIQGIVMTVCDFYALTEQGFVHVGRTFGYDFEDAAEGDGAWPLDLTGDGRSELITRSTYGDGMSCVFVKGTDLFDRFLFCIFRSVVCKPLAENIRGERQRRFLRAAFRVERQRNGIVLCVIGLRPRGHAEGRTQARKLRVRLIPVDLTALSRFLFC